MSTGTSFARVVPRLYVLAHTCVVNVPPSQHAHVSEVSLLDKLLAVRRELSQHMFVILLELNE